MTNRQKTMMMTLIMVLLSTGVSVVNEAPSAIAHSDMNDEEMMLIGGLYDLAPKSRRRPSATEAKNARRGFQILDSLGLCFGHDRDENLVLMPQPPQTRSGWVLWAALGAVLALAALHPAFGLAGLVGAVLAAPEATEDTTKEHDPTEGPSAEDMEAMKAEHKARPEWLKAIKDKALDQMWETFGPMLSGVLPRWQKPWKIVRNGIEYNVVNPVNALTGNRYNGANIYALSGAFVPVWATTKQINKLAKTLKVGLVWDEDYQTDWKEAPGSYMVEVNGEMRPLIKDLEDQNGSGQRAIWVPMKKTIWVDEKKNGAVVIGPNGKPKKKRISVVQKGIGGMTVGKEALVWNIEDTNLPIDAVLDRIKFEDSQPSPPVEEDIPVIEGAKALVDLVTANLTGLRYKEAPNRAFYSPAQDYISMPPAGTFKESDVSVLAAFAATLAHEGAHATGHRLRLARPLQNRFGDRKYAKEELIAELAAMIILRAWGFDDVPAQHAAYLKSWATKVVGKPDPENPDAWMDSCRGVLSKSAQAAEWVLSGMPEWFEGAKTTEGQQIEEKEPMPANAATMALEDLPSGYLFRAMDGGGRDAPSNANGDMNAFLYADMGLVSTTTTGDVHYGPFSPADSVRHDGVIHHAEEVCPIQISGDDFDAKILCLGTGEVLASMKIGEGWYNMGYDENGSIIVRYPEMGWVSIPAPQRAIGAMGFIPALLDPSMVTMVALGIAMVVGMAGFDRDTLLKEEEEGLEFFGPANRNESMATPKTIDMESISSYGRKDLPKEIGRHWHQMLAFGEKEIIEQEEVNQSASMAARPDSIPHIQVSRGGSVRMMTHRVWFSEKILLNLTVGIEEGDDGKKMVEIGAIGLEMEEGKTYAKNVFNVHFNIEYCSYQKEWLFNNHTGWGDLSFSRLEYGEMTYQWIRQSARMFDLIEGAFDTLFGTSHGGLEENEDGYTVIKNTSIISALTTAWAKYGAGAVRDAALNLHTTHEALLVSKGWLEATEEAQSRLDMIQRYGGVPNDLDIESSDNQWLKLSQYELATLGRDLGLTIGYDDPRVATDIREAFNCFDGVRWSNAGGGRTINTYHGVAPTRDGYTRLMTKSGRYGSILTKQGLVTLFKALLARKETHDKNQAAFNEAAREYVKQCSEEGVDPMEALIGMGRFEQIEKALKSLGNFPAGRAFLHIWANPPNDYNERERTYVFDDEEITISRIYCDRDFDDGSVAEDILGMMLENADYGVDLSRTVMLLVARMEEWETFASRIQDAVSWRNYKFDEDHTTQRLTELPPYIRATVERRFPSIVEESEEEAEAEAMGAVGAFALLPALLDPSMTTLVALGVAMVVGTVRLNMFGEKYEEEECQLLHCESCGARSIMTPFIDTDGEPNLVCEALDEDEVECGHIYWGMGAFSLLPALLDPSLTTLVGLGACVALSMVKAEPVVALPPSDDLKALWSQKHGWGLRTGTEDYKIMQTCLHDRVEILLAHLPEEFFDVKSEGTMYVSKLRECVESGEDISVSMVERVEEEVRGFVHRPWNAELWQRYVNALYDANLLDCNKSRFPEADRYQDGWCGCCAKPAMMDNPDNVVFQWWMRPTNLDGFTKMANRIARAFNSRDLGFWFEAGDATPQRDGDRTVWRLPMTVIHSPLTDSGWAAQAIIEPFDPACIKEGTDALVTMVPTGIEKATYDMKLEDGTTEAVTYDRAVWEEKTSIEVTGYLSDRHDGKSIFQYDPTICDHCGKKVHNRKKLVVVKHEEEGQRIVGSSCLYEYTDIDPKTLENLFSLHQNFDPYEGVATDPQSWKDSLARRDLEDFLEPLGVLIAHKGRYMKGTGMGNQAFSMIMGRDLAERVSRDAESRSIVADMAYYWYRGFRGDPKKTGWYPVSNVAIDQTLAREVREYIMASIEENVNKVKAGIKPFEIGDFGMKLAIVGRAGYVTAVRKGKMSATVNIVAGASSRYFKEKQKEEKVVLEAYPAEVGKTWTGSIQAVVTGKKSGEGYYGEWFLTILLVDGKYKMTTFSKQRAFLDSKIGDTIEITKFDAKKVEEYRDETSLVIGGSVIAKGVKA